MTSVKNKVGNQECARSVLKLHRCKTCWGAYVVWRGGAGQSGGGPHAGVRVGAEPRVGLMVAVVAGETWKLRAMVEGAGRRGSLDVAAGGALAASLLLMFCRGENPQSGGEVDPQRL